MVSPLRENWQEGKSLADCNLFLMENGYSDITFRLFYKHEGKQNAVCDIPALKVHCLARSPVFFAMLTGELAQQQQQKEGNPIQEIHDDYTVPEAFRLMLRFMYSDKVPLTNENVLAVLYLAQKYSVSTLTKTCVKYLEENLNDATATVILEQAMLYNETELKAKALQTIQLEAPEVLKSDAFLDLPQEALTEVLKLDLQVESEADVFVACVRWAKKQCVKLGVPVSGETIRDVLGRNLYLIRFPAMTDFEYVHYVSRLDVVTAEEGYHVLKYIIDKATSEKMPFPIAPRVPPPPSPAHLLVDTPYSRYGMQISPGATHTLHTFLPCTVSKRAFIRKIFVHPVTFNEYLNRQVTVTLTQKRRVLFESSTQFPQMKNKRPDYITINTKGVQVKAGDIELSIKLDISNYKNDVSAVTIICAQQGQSKVADDHLSITFPPTDINMLMGLEYQLMLPPSIPPSIPHHS